MIDAILAHQSQLSPLCEALRLCHICRHAWSVTSTRPALDKSPYLYTLTLSCPDERWPALGPIYEECQKSFRLTPTTKVLTESVTSDCSLSSWG